MSDLFSTGIRPAVDAHLLVESKKVRDYDQYWSASSSGYCMRKNIFERLKVPYTNEDARKQRVFTVGKIFHEWMQRITKAAGISIAQEMELRDETLMIIGHIDDLILIDDRLILYDYKSQNSRAFGYKRPMSRYHKMQLGTYMYMLRRTKSLTHPNGIEESIDPAILSKYFRNLKDGRILKISKDDLRMSEEQLLWGPELKKEVIDYWTELNKWWTDKKLPPCTCADYESGFMARPQFNPFYYNDEPCSIDWYMLNKEKLNAS